MRDEIFASCDARRDAAFERRLAGTSLTISRARIRAARAPSVSTFKSLCSRDSLAVSVSTIGADRTPSTLLAAIAIPTPVPQTRMPRSKRPPATPSATAREVGVIDRLAVGWCRSLRTDAHLVEQPLERVLELIPRVIRADGDFHSPPGRNAWFASGTGQGAAQKLNKIARWPDPVTT